MKKIFNFIKEHEKIFFLGLLIIFCILFFSTFIFTTIPLTQGWGQFYSDLISSGKIPYKDFYYYLPPYNLLLDWILWKLSFGHFMIYIIFRTIERLTIMSLIYLLLCKMVKPRYACLGTCVGTVIFSSTVYDLIGDYNQTCLLFVVILTTIYFKYLENLNSDDKKQYKLLFIAGIVIGLSFLLKQPLFVSECLIFFPLITLIFIFSKKKKYFKSLGISLLGIIIPIAIASIILAINGAFIPFIEQAYLGASGKGSIINILLVLVRACLKYKYLLLAAVISLYVYSFKKYKDDKTNKLNLIIILCMIATVVYMIFEKEVSSLEVLLNTKIGALFILVLCSLLLFDFILIKRKKENSILSYCIYILCLISIIFTLLIKSNTAEYIYNQMPLFDLINPIAVIMTIGTVIIIIYNLYNYKKTKEISYLKWTLIFSGGFTYEYLYSMGCTDSVSNIGVSMICATIIAYVLSRNNLKSLLNKYILICLSLFIVTAVVSQKVTNAYSWWGWNENVTNREKKYSINVPGLEGFKTTKEKKNMYEKMYKVLKENTNKESVIYGFPHIKIFNVLLKNSNMKTFVPVPFYDVCSDEYAIKDAENLKNNPPDIVIWVDLPNAIEVHEQIFRNGQPLGQRKIVEWFSEQLDKNEYILIGQYDNVFIYKKKSNSKIKYKYIKDKNSVNQTLISTTNQNKN